MGHKSFSVFTVYLEQDEMKSFLLDTQWVLTDDRLHSAVLRSLEQTHCARL